VAPTVPLSAPASCALIRAHAATPPDSIPHRAKLRLLNFDKEITACLLIRW
jgi:hypothetical protein